MLMPLSLGISPLVVPPSEAFPSILPTPTQNSSPNPLLLSGLCPEIAGRSPEGYDTSSAFKYSQRWAQVKTSSGSLNIRSSPNGAVIGEIPNGWQVVVGKYDSTRRWAYVLSDYRPDQRTGFASAPNFRSYGWVSVDYLAPLGEYCAKPLKLSLLPSSQLTAESKHQVSLEDIMLAWLNQP